MNWTVFGAYAKGIWAVAGPLVGVLIGAYIANRNLRRHWVADNKLREYQELVTAFTSAFTCMLRHINPAVGQTGTDIHAVTTEENSVVVTISDRVFVQREIRDLRVMDRWLGAREEFHSNYDVDVLANRRRGVV